MIKLDMCCRDWTKFHDLVTKVYNARPSNVPKNHWSRQKEAALIKAYRQVPDHIMDKIRRMYDTDFTLFGYDPRPPEFYSYRDKTNLDFV